MSSREDIKELCEGINDLGISDDKEIKINIVSSVKQKKNKSINNKIKSKKSKNKLKPSSKKRINRGTGAGGAQTNKNGLKFEKR